METRTCKNCTESFPIEPDDIEFYKKINVPWPTLCWKCRFQRRLAYRNERNAFWNVSAKSGKRIISIFPPGNNLKVYDEAEWRSDDWDGLDYGRDFDFSRPFFDQMHELAQAVPRFGPHTEDNVNCEYLINSGWSKNCYLVCNSSRTEDSAYGNAMDDSRFCFDNSHITKSERCYGSFWINNSYQSHFSTRSTDNTSVMFCFASKGLTNCFGCVNMTNKSYHIYNVPYSKEEYFKRMKAMKLNTWSGLQKAKEEAFAFALKFPIMHLNGAFNINVTGEYISDSKNVHYGYLVHGAKDVKYGQYLQVPGVEDSMDITIWGEKNIRAYENSTSGLNLSNSHFCEGSWAEIIDSEYCIACRGISNCFGCVGLKKKKYCIFNKQYSREEYFAKISSIKSQMTKNGEYGEFFPIKHSLIPYNVSLAQEHFPLTKEQALAKGYSWYDKPKKDYQITMTAAQIPDAIEDVPDSILKEILECIECKQAYRVIEMELAFLRQEKLPILRQCVDCRHQERITQRAKAFLYHRACGCRGKASTKGYTNTTTHIHGDAPCPTEFETAYPTSDPRIIYCLPCLYAEVN